MSPSAVQARDRALQALAVMDRLKRVVGEQVGAWVRCLNLEFAINLEFAKIAAAYCLQQMRLDSARARCICTLQAGWLGWRLQPTAEALGHRLGVDGGAVGAFSEEVVRGTAAAPLSQVLGIVEPW